MQGGGKETAPPPDVCDGLACTGGRCIYLPTGSLNKLDQQTVLCLHRGGRIIASRGPPAQESSGGPPLPSIGFLALLVSQKHCYPNIHDPLFILLCMLKATQSLSSSVSSVWAEGSEFIRVQWSLSAALGLPGALMPTDRTALISKPSLFLQHQRT